MRIRSKALLLILALLMCTSALTACSGGVGEALDKIQGFSLGEWEDNVYTNDKFDLKISLPEEWYVFTSEELEGIFGEAINEFEESDAELNDGAFMPLLFIMDNSDYNLATGNMNLTATRSLIAPNYEEEYSEEAVDELAAEMMQYGAVEISIDGEVDFSNTKAFLITMNTTIAGTDMVQYQKIYQVYDGGYLLTFTFTGFDESFADETIGYISYK